MPTRRFISETAATKDRPFPAPDAYCGAVIAKTEKADWTFLGTNHRRFLGGNEGTDVTFADSSEPLPYSANALNPTPACPNSPMKYLKRRLKSLPQSRTLKVSIRD